MCLIGGCWQGEAEGRLTRSRTSYVIGLIHVICVFGVAYSAFSSWS